jgi:Domain of unknown function (DUF4956)
VTVSAALAADYRAVTERLVLDIAAISVFAVAVYFRRYRRSDMAMVYGFFNICLYVTGAVIQMTEVAAALGFGLFAILSIIRLRSEPFSNREIGYFIGSLVLGLLNGVGAGSLWFTALLNAVVIVAIVILDHAGVFPRSDRIEITFDHVFADQHELTLAVATRTGRTVEHIDVLAIDYVRDAMQLDVRFAPAAIVAPTPIRRLRPRTRLLS